MSGPGARNVNLGSEAELLLCCAQARLGSKTTDRVRSLLGQGIDWIRLTRDARRHGMVPLVYQTLAKTFPQAIPKATLDQLRGHYQAAARRSFALTGELIRCLDLLTSHGIEAVPYRGPVLAASAYGDVSMRQFVDLDRGDRPYHYSWVRSMQLMAFGYRYTGQKEYLDVGEFYEGTITGQIPEHVSGVYHAMVYADAWDQVFELTFDVNINPDDPNVLDNNNFKAAASPLNVLYTPPADLEVTHVDAPATACSYVFLRPGSCVHMSPVFRSVIVPSSLFL